MEITVIGIDCATQPNKVGLALGTFDGLHTTVTEVTLGSTRATPADVVEGWIRSRPGAPVLLALDAPLGWPLPLAETLPSHRAGEPLVPAANDLFRRATDRFVAQEIGKLPLDVGADRIARTARSALALIGELRCRLKLKLPLAWEIPIEVSSAIEVYPAATLRAHRIFPTVPVVPGRGHVKEALREKLQFQGDLQPQLWGLDEVDAVVCLLAAHDFLLGAAFSPQQRSVAEKEGWIWVRRPGHEG